MKTMVLSKMQNPAPYPYSSSIQQIVMEEKTGGARVTWLFPNGHRVELLCQNFRQAELLYISPEVVLPEEGEDGRFYTSQEIQLFLTRIQNLTDRKA